MTPTGVLLVNKSSNISRASQSGAKVFVVAEVGKLAFCRLSQEQGFILLFTMFLPAFLRGRGRGRGGEGEEARTIPPALLLHTSCVNKPFDSIEGGRRGHEAMLVELLIIFFLSPLSRP